MITTWLRRKIAAWLRAQASDIEAGLPTRARSTWNDAPPVQVAPMPCGHPLSQYDIDYGCRACGLPQQVPNLRPPQWHEFVGLPVEQLVEGTEIEGYDGITYVRRLGHWVPQCGLYHRSLADVIVWRRDR